jgi:hypothetical protein
MQPLPIRWGQQIKRETDTVMRAVRHILPLKAAWLLLLSGLLSGCGKEDFALPTSCACGHEETVETVKELQGVISFNSQLSKYTISRNETGPLKPQFVYIVCDLPAGYPLEDQSVLFSGKVKPACREPKPVLPGQQYFDIELTKLLKIES